MLRTNSAY